MKRYIIKLILPIIAVLLSIAAYYGLSDSGKQKATNHPYYVYLMLIVSVIYIVAVIASIFVKKIRVIITNKAPLLTGIIIQSTNQVHFEVSSTLGASTLYKVLHVAIPSAMPSIFLGIFYGTVSSFATLMAVEMNGNSSGIGWYINWQKQVMMYDGVYAGLIIIAVLCSLILTLLFKVRDRILVWQKGVIKW